MTPYRRFEADNRKVKTPSHAFESGTFCKPKAFSISCEKDYIMVSGTPIPQQRAIDLCREYREKHKVRLFSQCWGCIKFSKEEPSKMCFYNPPENRGCKFVNEMFDQST